MVQDDRHQCPQEGSRSQQLRGWPVPVQDQTPYGFSHRPNSYEVGLYLFLYPQKLTSDRDKLVRKFAQCKADIEADPTLYKKGSFFEKYYVIGRNSEGKIANVGNNTDAQAPAQSGGAFGREDIPGVCGGDLRDVDPQADGRVFAIRLLHVQ